MTDARRRPYVKLYRGEKSADLSWQSNSLEESADGPVCGAEYPLIAPGTRTLLCVAAKIYRHPGLPDHPWKCQLEFSDGLDELPHLFGFLNLGTGPKPHAGRTSRYWAAWCLANGGPPKKRQTMSSRSALSRDRRRARFRRM